MPLPPSCADPRNPSRNWLADHHAAVGVTTQDDVIEFFRLDTPDHIAHVGFEGDRLGCEVCFFAESRVRRGVYRVTHRTQRRGRVAVAPSSVPRAVNQYEVCHLRLPNELSVSMPSLTGACK